MLIANVLLPDLTAFAPGLQPGRAYPLRTADSHVRLGWARVATLSPRRLALTLHSGPEAQTPGTPLFDLEVTVDGKGRVLHGRSRIVACRILLSEVAGPEPRAILRPAPETQGDGSAPLPDIAIRAARGGFVFGIGDLALRVGPA